MRPGIAVAYSGTVEALLRPLQLEDADAVLAAFGADDQMTLQGEVTDRDSAQQYIELLTDVEESNAGFAVQVDGWCAGVVGINGASTHRLGWFFYWMHPRHRGRGLTSQAATAAANWALADTASGGGFERLELGHRENNPASGAVAVAAGFIPEGRERKKFLVNGERVDVLTYGRLRTDPVPGTVPLPLTTTPNMRRIGTR